MDTRPVLVRQKCTVSVSYHVTISAPQSLHQSDAAPSAEYQHQPATRCLSDHAASLVRKEGEAPPLPKTHCYWGKKKKIYLDSLHPPPHAWRKSDPTGGYGGCPTRPPAHSSCTTAGPRPQQALRTTSLPRGPPPSWQALLLSGSVVNKRVRARTKGTGGQRTRENR